MSEPSTPPARDTPFHQLYPKTICHVIPHLLGIARNRGSPSHLLHLPPLPTDYTSVASTANSQRSLNSSISRFSRSQMRPTRVSLLRVFLFSSFFSSKEQVLVYLKFGRWRITQTLGPRVQEILPSLRTLTNETERTLDLPRRTGLNRLQGAKFQRFLTGKSVFQNSKFQIREFHAH